MSNVTTEAGLIVPESAVVKKSRVLPADTFKKLRRFIRDMHAEALMAMMACEDCKTGITLVVDKVSGQPVIVCQCSERVVR